MPPTTRRVPRPTAPPAELSYRKATWEPRSRVEKLKPQLLRNFLSRADEAGGAPRSAAEAVPDDWTTVQRVISKKPGAKVRTI